MPRHIIIGIAPFNSAKQNTHNDEHDDGNDDDDNVVAVAAVAAAGDDDRHHDDVGKSFEFHPDHDKIIMTDVGKNADKSSLYPLL
jgi:hypothetical protein